MNNSDNVLTVVNRFEDLENVMTKLMLYDTQLLNSVVSLNKPIDILYNEIKENKQTLFNQAITRAYHKELQSAKLLKTNKGQTNKMIKFFERTKQISKLSVLNINHLSGLEIQFWQSLS